MSCSSPETKDKKAAPGNHRRCFAIVVDSLKKNFQILQRKIDYSRGCKIESDLYRV
jgi:hypothetical protein